MKSAIGRGQVSPGSLPGTYILLMRLPRGQALTIGYLGRREFARGWYLYVGSAFGPGGVAARCNHHRRGTSRPRWHVDYLRGVMPLREIWFTHDPLRREHQWADILLSNPSLEMPVKGCGASDCDCQSHLLYTLDKPDYEGFSHSLLKKYTGHGELYCEILPLGVTGSAPSNRRSR
ncbi:MAG: GIY-YIG nuclease family protein [Candidatus Thiodiazotropha sp.]